MPGLDQSTTTARQVNGSDLRLELQRHAQQKKASQMDRNTTTSSAASTFSTADTLQADQDRANQRAREDAENQRKGRFYHAAATVFSLK